MPAGQRCATCYPPWATRPATWAGGSTRRWRRLRAAKLATDPLCQWPDCVQLADEVDHITPLHLFPEGPQREAARYDWANLRSLCVPHHRVITQEQARRARQARQRRA